MKDRRTITLKFLETQPGERLTLRITVGRNGPVDTTIEAEGATLRPDGDALFAFGYLPACELKYDLRIEGDVSPELLSGTGDLFELYSRWYGYKRQPQIDARAKSVAGVRAEDALLFFSGGVDSCYSLIEAKDKVRSLVTVVGMDVRPAAHAGAEWVARLGREFGGQFGLRAIILRTDARRWFDRMVSWDQFHGPFLAGMAHLLSANHGRALIAGTYGGEGLSKPWGSHPDHEHRYSSDTVRLEHHLPHTRLVKLRRLLGAGLTRHLRVCLKPTGDQNCGVCRKCTYLRVALRLLAGEAAVAEVSFARPGPGDFEMAGLGILEFWSELLDLAGEQGEREIIDLVLKARRRFERRAARRRLLRLPDFGITAKRTKRRVRASLGVLFRFRP